MIRAPIALRGIVFGFLSLSSTAPHHFTPKHVDRLSRFAAQAAVAIANARLYEQVRTGQEHLRALTNQLAEVEESERQRLARELHDQVGQNLTALGLNLNIVRSLLPDTAAESVHDRLLDSQTLVEQTIQIIRDVMADLRPPLLDDYGLVAALHWHAERFEARTGITCRVLGEDLTPRLSSRRASALFRIAQEALNNASKHAQASLVTVTVEDLKKQVRLVIADDGVGFDPGQREVGPDKNLGWGLSIMNERAEAAGGSFRLESNPGQGTRVTVEAGR
jgi:signal transduction histidine kinase